MALYIPHSIFHLARFLYVRPETSGPYYVLSLLSILRRFKNFSTEFGIRMSPFVPFDFPLALSKTNKIEVVFQYSFNSFFPDVSATKQPN